MKTEEWGGGRGRDVTKVDGGSAFIHGGGSAGMVEDVPGGISSNTQVITQSECY